VRNPWTLLADPLNSIFAASEKDARRQATREARQGWRTQERLNNLVGINLEKKRKLLVTGCRNTISQGKA